MWRHLSLRARLNALSASLLALALAINIGSTIVGAGSRVEAEIDSSMRLSTEFVEAALANLHGYADPDAALDRLVASMQNLRHVKIYRRLLGGTKIPAAPAPHRVRTVPRWFVSLVHAAPRTTKIAAAIDGRSFGDIVIASYPSDEMNEIWEAVGSLAVVGTCLVLVVFALTFWIVDRALAPIRDLRSGLARLGSGNYAARIQPSGPPEFIAIGAELNSLGETLGRSEVENRLLVQKLISVQDDERKELARELHDEFGAHLFAIRANMTSLVMASGSGSHDPRRFADTGKSILGLTDSLQRINRRILNRLRPTALGELGLADAVRGLVAIWAGSHPQVRITVDLPDALDGLDEVLGLTIYRVVQESLTNVFRHSGADRVDLSIRYTDEGPESLQVVVGDNGTGLRHSAKPGLGLLGMRERLRAVGGTLDVASESAGGLVLRANVPLVPAEKAAAE